MLVPFLIWARLRNTKQDDSYLQGAECYWRKDKTVGAWNKATGIWSTQAQNTEQKLNIIQSQETKHRTW